MVWWVERGYPPFEEGKGGFPRTGQVIKYYRERDLDEDGKAWTRVTFAGVLNITEQAVANLENRDAGMDSDRRRFLCKLLNIPPVLLGIVMLEDILKIIEEQKENVSWWVECGYPSFTPGKDGYFPRTGEVVKYYREQKMNDKGKPWTQEALARVLGISEQAVRDIENKDAAMDHDRRHFLSKLFDIPPILFGIVTLDEILKTVDEQKTKTDISAFSPSLWTPHKTTIDTIEYHEHLVTLWNTHHSHTALGFMGNTLLRVDTLYRELSHIRSEEWPQIWELLCEYHQFVAHLLRDQQNYNAAIGHMNKAYQMAKILQNDELKVLALHRRGNTLCDAGRIDEAIHDYEEAKRYEKVLPSNLKGSVLLHAGLVGAKAAKSDKWKQKAAIALIDLGGHIVGNLQNEEDPYFLKLNQGRYHLDKGIALIAVGRNKDAIDELKLLQCGPRYPRRQAYSDILQAQAHVNCGEYSEAALLAETALLVFQGINSEVNIARVAKIHEQLRRSSFRNNPEVARLEYLLMKK